MPHPKQIDSDVVLRAAMELLEAGGPSGISLRGVAAKLGVKAPSLYRYFAEKAALEQALVEEGTRLLYLELVQACEIEAGFASRPEGQLRALAEAYVGFARRRSAIYFFLMQQASEPNQSPSGKKLWNMLLAVIRTISGNPDDTDSAVAAWSFLHGFVGLERFGRFGPSGPKDRFEHGLEALFLLCKTKRVPATERSIAKPLDSLQGKLWG